MVILPSVSVGAGILAGCFGIGGGMVIAPILYEIGLIPSVVSATSSFMVFINTLSAMIMFGISGSFSLDYAILLGFLSLISSATGWILIKRWVDRTGKQSTLVLILAIMLGIATVVLVAKGVQDVVQDVSDGNGNWGINDIC